MMRGVVDITLLGNEEEIRQKASALGISLTGMNMIDPMTAARRNTFGGCLLRTPQA